MNSTWYHGTTDAVAQKALTEGLRLNPVTHRGVFLTDTLSAALDYAQERAERSGDTPAVLTVTLPEIQTQPNGSPAPPYYFDDYHRDTFTDGSIAYEYDSEVPASAVNLTEHSHI